MRPEAKAREMLDKADGMRKAAARALREGNHAWAAKLTERADDLTDEAKRALRGDE